MAHATDAISLLTADHDEVRTMFRELERGGAQSEQLFLRIRDALQAHTTIEEEIFYPAAEPHVSDLVGEARQEHHGVDQLLDQIATIQPQDVRWEQMMRDLIQNVEHHAGEEESKMFPKLRETLGMDELRRLGDQMEQRKASIMSRRGRTAA